MLTTNGVRLTPEAATKQEQERWVRSGTPSIAGSTYFDADDADWQVSFLSLSFDFIIWSPLRQRSSISQKYVL